MSELNEIRPTYRIIPTKQEHHTDEKKKKRNYQKDQDKDRKPSGNNKGKVDEYI